MRSDDGVWSVRPIDTIGRRHRLKFQVDAEAEHQCHACDEKRGKRNQQRRNKQEEGSETAEEQGTDEGKDKACHRCFKEHPRYQPRTIDYGPVDPVAADACS